MLFDESLELSWQRREIIIFIFTVLLGLFLRQIGVASVVFIYRTLEMFSKLN